MALLLQDGALERKQLTHLRGKSTAKTSVPKTVQRILKNMGNNLSTTAIKEIGGLVAEKLRAREGDDTDIDKRGR